MGFEVFTRKSAALTREPVIGIQKRGTFSLNASAAELIREAAAARNIELESPDALNVELLFDPDEKLIAFRPAESSPDAYSIRKQPNSESFLLTGRAFTQHYRIDTSKVRRFIATRNDDLVVVDLKAPKGGRTSGKGDAAER